MKGIFRIIMLSGKFKIYLSELVSKWLLLSEPRANIRLWKALQQRATEETVDFIREHMQKAVFCYDKLDVLTYALSLRNKEGIIAEFGVFSGKTINLIAEHVAGQEVHGFDSFEGLPEQWSGYKLGKNWFNRNGEPPAVRDNVKLHIGWFDDTVPGFFKNCEELICLLHVDCDLYSSTKTVLDAAAPLITDNTIIVFDDFFNYPGFQEHEMKAFDEFIKDHGFEYEFIAYSGNQAAVRIIVKPT